MLHDLGLERFYALDDDAGRQTKLTGRSYAELDDAAFQGLHCRPTAEGWLTADLYLEGVHCAACVWLVEKLPTLPDARGVVSARLDLTRQAVQITWDPTRTRLSRAAALLESLGYTPHPVRGGARERMRRREDRRFVTRLAVAGAAAGNVMLLAFALYSGLWSGMSAAHMALFSWASMAIALPAVLWAGAPFFRGALAALRTRSLHMDLPIAVGLAAGLGWSVWSTLRGHGEVYYDTVTMLVFLLLLGRYLQRRQQRRAADAAELMLSLTPRTARLLEGAGASREVPVEALVPGDEVEVLAGDSIPADGVVLHGESRVDAALLTGESAPAPVGPGAELCAGTVNMSARLRVRVSATGEQTRVGQLLAQVEAYARRRAPVVLLADRLAGIFVATALGLACLTFLIWWVIAPERALPNAMALLIVTCPCALGLATPLAVSVAIGRAARRGILIKGGDVLQLLTRPGHIYLDKTGTLTAGRVSLEHASGDRSVWPLVAALERQSAHPLARALAAALDAEDDLEVREVQEVAGGGITGVVAGRRVRVGSPAFIGADGDEAALQAAADALTPVLAEVDGEVRARFALGDPLRPDAADTLAGLRRRGWNVGILSGDHPEVVAAVARRLGLEPGRCRGGLSPEQKLSAVERAGRTNPVVMVGDGVNDAAALAAAHLGIAVHGGAEASLAAADVFLDRPGLAPVVELMDGARRTLAVIRRNLVFSLAYNIVAAALSVAGLVHPLLAALLMPLSSLTVVTSSYRGRTFAPPAEAAQAVGPEGPAVTPP